jgi:hypothetical protein
LPRDLTLEDIERHLLVAKGFRRSVLRHEMKVRVARVTVSTSTVFHESIAISSLTDHQLHAAYQCETRDDTLRRLLHNERFYRQELRRELNKQATGLAQQDRADRSLGAVSSLTAAPRTAPFQYQDSRDQCEFQAAAQRELDLHGGSSGGAVLSQRMFEKLSRECAMDSNAADRGAAAMEFAEDNAWRRSIEG